MNSSGVVVWTEPPGVNLVPPQLSQHHRPAEVLGPDAPGQPDVLVRQRGLPASRPGHQRQHPRVPPREHPERAGPGRPEEAGRQDHRPGGRHPLLRGQLLRQGRGQGRPGPRQRRVDRGPLGLAADVRLLRRRRPDARHPAWWHDHRRRRRRRPLLRLHLHDPQRRRARADDPRPAQEPAAEGHPVGQALPVLDPLQNETAFTYLGCPARPEEPLEAEDLGRPASGNTSTFSHDYVAR